MKTLRLIATLLMFGGPAAFAAFPTHMNADTNNIDKIEGGFTDSHWKWQNVNDQDFQLDITNNAGWVTLTNYSVGARLSKAGTTYVDIRPDDIVTSTYRATFSIDRTNIPPASVYDFELTMWSGAATNDSRTLWQGKISVTKSLYSDTNSFPFPSWTTNDLSSYMTIATYDTNDNDIVDTSDAFVAYITSGAGSMALTNAIYAEGSTSSVSVASQEATITFDTSIYTDITSLNGATNSLNTRVGTLDSTVVTKAGAQTITGVKTFDANIKVNTDDTWSMTPVNDALSLMTIGYGTYDGASLTLATATESGSEGLASIRLVATNGIFRISDYGSTNYLEFTAQDGVFNFGGNIISNAILSMVDGGGMTNVPAYCGSLGKDDDAGEVYALTTSYQRFTNWTAVATGKGVTTTSSNMVTTLDGEYDTSFHMGGTGVGGSPQYTFAIHTNNAVCRWVKKRRDTGGTTAGSASASSIIYLPAGTTISLQGKSDGSDNFTALQAGFSVKWAGE